MPTNQQRHVKQIVIPKEEAVFRMDGRGRWHNRHGLFQHKKIIDHFNAAIKKDAGGYFVSQCYDNIYEKVYFPYEETALFAVDLIWGNCVRMILNTGEKLDLAPQRLFVRDDHIYHEKGEGEIIKFTERAMTALAEKIEHHQGRYVLVLGGDRICIPEL